MKEVKGQAALEYLMTYGLALIIIVGVIAALISLGVFGGASPKVCTGFSYFIYKDAQLTENDFKIQVANRQQDVTVRNLSIDGVDLGALTLTPAGNVGAGKSVTIDSTSDPTTKLAGDSYSVAVSIAYDVVGGIAGRTDRATCSGKIE